MKKWFVKLFYNLGWRRLARRISMPLYYVCVYEQLARQCWKATKAFSTFANILEESLPKKEGNDND